MRATRNMRAGRMTVVAQADHKDKATGKRIVDKAISESKVLGLREGAATAQVGIGMTKTENYNSVRVDITFTIPCDQTAASLKETVAEIKEAAAPELDSAISELQEALRGVRLTRAEQPLLARGDRESAPARPAREAGGLNYAD
jgi:hypothetical protein